MAIDFLTRSRNLNLAYLFRGVYHDEDGVERQVHWCGPKSRVGSGLSLKTPVYSGDRDAIYAQWEARMTRCSLDSDLGTLAQNIQVINDLTFNVDVSGGPQSSIPSVGDLRRDIVYGRWRTKKGTFWLLDLDTGDTQIVADGVFDRNPTSMAANVFQIVVSVAPLGGLNLQLPMTEIPVSAAPGSSGWTYDQGVSGFHWFAPTQFMLNPDHMGKYVGPNFGNALTAGDNFVWREIVPYGRRTSSSPGPAGMYNFAHVSPHTGCFVEELYFEDTINEGVPRRKPSVGGPSTHYLATFENLDPTMGPIGTNVRFSTSQGASPPGDDFFVWWGPGTPSSGGAQNRVFARCSGPNTGVPDFVHVDTNGGYPVTVYKDGGTARSRVWEVLEDLTMDPQYLGLTTDPWGSGSLADFQANLPAVANPIPYADLACVVPREVAGKPPPMRDVFGNLGASFPFDITIRLDPTVGEMRLYPIWRSGFLSAPDKVFRVEDMARTDPPAVQQFDDSDGKYANKLDILPPEYYRVPLTTTGLVATSEGENQIDPTRQERFLFNQTFEQLPDKEGQVVEDEITWEHWLHSGTTGNSQAAWTLGSERAQPQRTVQAVHGVRSFDVQMGDYIRYDMIGINEDVGMVRKMRYDFDTQTIQITTYHVDHPTGRAEMAGTNVSDRHEPDEGSI